MGFAVTVSGFFGAIGAELMGSPPIPGSLGPGQLYPELGCSRDLADGTRIHRESEMSEWAVLDLFV